MVIPKLAVTNSWLKLHLFINNMLTKLFSNVFYWLGVAIVVDWLVLDFLHAKPELSLAEINSNCLFCFMRSMSPNLVELKYGRKNNFVWANDCDTLISLKFLGTIVGFNFGLISCKTYLILTTTMGKSAPNDKSSKETLFSTFNWCFALS